MKGCGVTYYYNAIILLCNKKKISADIECDYPVTCFHKQNISCDARTHSMMKIPVASLKRIHTHSWIFFRNLQWTCLLQNQIQSVPLLHQCERNIGHEILKNQGNDNIYINLIESFCSKVRQAGRQVIFIGIIENTDTISLSTKNIDKQNSIVKKNVQLKYIFSELKDAVMKSQWLMFFDQRNMYMEPTITQLITCMLICLLLLKYKGGVSTYDLPLLQLYDVT